MTDKIIKALRELDVNNDNHWTDAGLPRIETVRMLAGNGSLSRDEVTAAAPGFTRQNPNLENAATSAPVVPPVPTPPPAPVTPVAAPAAPLPGAENTTVAGENNAPIDNSVAVTGENSNEPAPAAVTIDLDEVAQERSRDLATMQNYLSRLEGERDAILAEIDKVRREIDKAVLEDAEVPAEDPMVSWKRNLENEVEKRIEFQKEFGPKLKALGDLPKVRSPLDSAMAAQNDRKRREGNR